MKKFILSILFFIPILLTSQNQTLTVTFTEIPSNDGRLTVVLFKGKEGYTQQKPFLTKSLDINNFTATWEIDSIAPGDYIISSFHDENVNGKMDFAPTGMPEEAFAFSNNAQPKMGPPNPDEMLLSIKAGDNAVQNIKMLYFGMKTKQVKEVEVVADKKQMVKVDADKTTYQVKDNAALTTGSMRDAVRKLPGIVMSPSGDLNYNGKGVTIYIDGVPSNLSGSDLKNYLSSIPATNIEKIELVENPGASYEANTSGAVVNIVTRGIATQEVSGSVNMHYGYSEGDHKLSPSLMLLGRKNKLNWQLQTGYNWHQQTIWNTSDQTFTNTSPSVIFTHNTTQQNLTRNLYVRPMFNLRLTENSYIVFNYNLNIGNNQYDNTSNTTTKNFKPFNDEKELDYVNKFYNPEKNRNNELVLKYKTMLDSLGRSMQITGYYSNFYKNSTGKSTQLLVAPVYGINNTNLNLNNAYGKVDFEIPFKKISFNVGAKYNITNSHNLGRYDLGNLSSAVFETPVYNDSIDFNYNEKNLAAYLEARKTIGKLSATLGVRYENLSYKSYVENLDSITKGSVKSLFPTVNLLYRLVPNVNLSARYSRKIAMPAYDQLDPNASGYFDQYSTTKGNQELKPNFFDNYSFNVSAFNYANFGSYMSYSKNISLLSNILEDENLFKTAKMSKTYDDIKMYGLYMSVPVPFGLITKGAKFFKEPMNMSTMSYAHVFLSCNFNDIGGFEYTNGLKPTWMFNLNTHVVLPLKLTLDGNWFHMFRGSYQIYTFKKAMNFWQVDLTRKFMKEKLEVTAEATQIPSQTLKFSTPKLTTDFSNKIDGVTFWLKFSYRFGSFNSKEETQIDVEKKELEGGGINVRK